MATGTYKTASFTLTATGADTVYDPAGKQFLIKGFVIMNTSPDSTTKVTVYRGGTDAGDIYRIISIAPENYAQDSQFWIISDGTILYMSGDLADVVNVWLDGLEIG